MEAIIGEWLLYSVLHLVCAINKNNPRFLMQAYFRLIELPFVLCLP